MAGDTQITVVGNLVDDPELRFTPSGGSVVVSLERRNGGSDISVADTGCGIDPDHIKQLFYEFSKVPSANPTAQGAQLGLFITKSLVTMHQGTIWVESTPGAGTRFYFTMPAASSREAAPQQATGRDA